LTTIGTGVPSKLQDFDYATAGNHLFYPALTQSKGEIALIYGESSTTIYPSLFVTGRLANDPINTLQTPAMIVRNGTAYDSSQRYGDYFGAATDPTPGQGYAFWLAGEYRTSTSGTAWSTVIAGIMSLSNTLTVAVNNNASIDQSIIVTNGTLTVFPSSSTFSGRITVRASSSSTGSLLFSKTYNLPTLNLHSATDSSLQSSFILKISVIPYALSSDITLNLKNGTATFEVNVTRNLDIGGNGVSVNLIDLSILLLDYGSVQGDSKYNPVADIDGSGNISILDVGMESFYYNAPVFS
jgi:hypothetical protein